MWIELKTSHKKLYTAKYEVLLSDGSVGVLTGLDGDDLDVDLHEVGGRVASVSPAPACGLGHLALVGHAGVGGETDRPHLPVELNRLLQSENLNTDILD